MNHRVSQLSSKAPTRARTRVSTKTSQTQWSESEDSLLTSLMDQKAPIDILLVSFPEKTQQQILDRWNKVLNPQLVKGSWTTAEDEFITKWVQENGPRNWSTLAASLPGRLGKQCRERWVNNLSPDLNHQPWSEDEDKILIEHQQKWGNKWAKIAQLLPGRTDNSVKNRWNSTLKRKLQRIANGENPVSKRGRKPKRASNAPEIASKVPSSAEITIISEERLPRVIEIEEEEPAKPHQEQIPKPDFSMIDMTIPSPAVQTPQLISPFIQMSPILMKDSPFFPLWSPGSSNGQLTLKSPLPFGFDQTEAPRPPEFRNLGDNV